MQKYIKTNRLEISAMVKRDLPDLNSLLSSLKLRNLVAYKCRLMTQTECWH